MFSSISFTEFKKIMQEGMDRLFNTDPGQETQPLIVTTNTENQKENDDDQIKTSYTGD